MVRLRSAVLLLLVAIASMAKADERASAAPQVGENALQLPTWQSGWSVALRSGNCAEAEQHLAEGRRSNQAVADTMEAVMVRDGICRPADSGKAETLFQRAIRQRYIPAMMGLGWGYLGHGLTEDNGKARYWFQRAALLWNTFPMRLKAADDMTASELYLTRDGDLPDWASEILVGIGMLAIRGEDVKADNADRIEAGDGFLPDPQAACLWRIDAVKSGSSKAAVTLGDQLLQGRGVPARPDRAAYWWNVYASAPAEARLGALLVEGADGVPADPRAALILLTSAKQRGEAVDDSLRLAAERAIRPSAIASKVLKEKTFLTNPPWNHPEETDCWR